MSPLVPDPIRLFGEYMKVTGLPTLTHPGAGDPRLQGRKLGVVNGSSWTSLWSSWFGRTILPEVQLAQVGNEAVQLNFMRAHQRHEPCPPRINIDLAARYAEDLVRLWGVDAVILTCSTMNRAASAVRQALAPLGVPVVQIDEAMMEQAVARGGRVLVVATHGPTVRSTQDLLTETAQRTGTPLSFHGATVEEAFHRLGEGDIEGHNRVVAAAIRQALEDARRAAPDGRSDVRTVILAQLSMSVFKFTWSDGRAEKEFGVPVLTSGETGFARAREVLLGLAR